jgi:hypothetical protein
MTGQMSKPFAVVFACLLLALTVEPVQAASPDKEAAAHYSIGNRAFEEGDFARAIDELKQSVAIKPTVKAYLVLGNAYLKLGQLDDARAAFEKVLEVDPHSSKRKVVEQHIKDLTTLAKTKLVVSTTPPGATLYIDLKAEGARGKTPITLPVLPGRHRVMLELEGYEAATVEAVAVEGQDVPVTATLRMRGCDLSVATLPDKAELHIDNGEARMTPATARVPMGEHTLTLAATGYLPKTRVVSCAAENQPINVTETLERPPTAMLTVRSAGASVRVDGKPVADPTRLVLPVGKHDVDLEAPGKAPWHVTLGLSSGQELELSPRLDAPAAPAKTTSLTVASGIPFAQVSIDGKIGAPGKLNDVDPGTHFVEVRARGYDPLRQQITVADGEQRLVSTHLERRGTAALIAGVAFSMLAVGSAGLTVAAYYSANRELSTSSAYGDWHRTQLAGYGLLGATAGLALVCFITAGAQAGTGGPGAEWKQEQKITIAPTTNGVSVAGRF